MSQNFWRTLYIKQHRSRSIPFKWWLNINTVVDYFNANNKLCFHTQSIKKYDSESNTITALVYSMRYFCSVPWIDLYQVHILYILFTSGHIIDIPKLFCDLYYFICKILRYVLCALSDVFLFLLRCKINKIPEIRDIWTYRVTIY